MKTFRSTYPVPGQRRTFSNVCRASCQTLIAQIERTKQAILTEFRESLQAPEHLLRLALNEAEALAWQTAYPHLVFPALATEKAEALGAWLARQRSNQTRGAAGA